MEYSNALADEGTHTRRLAPCGVYSSAPPRRWGPAPQAASPRTGLGDGLNGQRRQSKERNVGCAFASSVAPLDR